MFLADLVECRVGEATGVANVQDTAELASVEAFQAEEFRSRERPGAAVIHECREHVPVVESDAGLVSSMLLAEPDRTKSA
ncbi:hypothetical protein ON010_g16212 [Phytophthora cinnamomi]|nr:hypothetical protein ON010_g16212 [Phytophthora cinnamomi]